MDKGILFHLEQLLYALAHCCCSKIISGCYEYRSDNNGKGKPDDIGPYPVLFQIAGHQKIQVETDGQGLDDYVEYIFDKEEGQKDGIGGF
jgi:hypothetical protein